MFRSILFLMLLFSSALFAQGCIDLDQAMENKDFSFLLETLKIHFWYFNQGKTATLLGFIITLLAYLPAKKDNDEDHKRAGRILFAGIAISMFFGLAIGFKNALRCNDPSEPFYQKMEKKTGESICRTYDFF